MSAVLPSTSLNDSQAALPLAKMTVGRVTDRCDLMDAACDAKEIREVGRRLGHVPLIGADPRRGKERKEEMKREARALCACGLVMPEAVRCRIRSRAERTNARLKDGAGALQQFTLIYVIRFAYMAGHAGRSPPFRFADA